MKKGYKVYSDKHSRLVLSKEVTLVGDEDEEITIANTKRVLNRAWALLEYK